MNVSLRIVGALLAIRLFCVCAEAHAARSDAPQDTEAIQKIIAQLGDEQYSVRHRAEQQLIELGTAAFDQLLAASVHSDLEISSRASYILPRLRIQWEREDDPAEVRGLLKAYGELPQSERENLIQTLAVLGDHRGLGPLCRITRYEASPTIARAAAVAILNSKKVATDRLAWAKSVVEQETSGSSRRPVQWIQLHFDRLQQPADAADAWLGHIDHELALLKKGESQTNAEVVFGLLKYDLAECRLTGGQGSTFEPLRRMIDLRIDVGGEFHNAMVFALSWSTDNEQWKTVEQLENHYADQLGEDRLLLYMLAESAQRQGESGRANEIAERAFQLAIGDIHQRYEVSSMIGELGRHDWAEREWQYMIENLPVSDGTSFAARRDLATMRLFDREEYQKAADLLGEALDAINKQMGEDKNKKRQFNSKTGRQWLAQNRAQQDFFLACQEEKQGNFQQQRKLLDAAYKGDVENPDVLIAMYRLQGADEAYKKTTLGRIQALSRKLETQIEAEPSVPNYYNHWAWLISNTEGDFKKAVAYSRRSIEVVPKEPYLKGMLGICYDEMRSIDWLPPSPSYLDTLGRCYYAAGDLDSAIKYQRQAIRRHPHMAVMRRQLELFERELAARDEK
ncbi:MAG: hypothetical protein GXP26_08545 [Planctomycetes bacterium]|nr:hypothetical protein [Planctomycetota bacterium]